MIEALINAGGKGSRMGMCGIEKPMQIIGGKPTVMRVVEAFSASENIGRILVSVSGNTPETERYLKDVGVETIRTSGESFVDDIHDAFEIMNGKYVFISPSDLPLLSTKVIDDIIENFNPARMESLIALVDSDMVLKMGGKPSFTIDRYGAKWVLSGLSVMDREKTVAGEYLQESYLEFDCMELALNVNTQQELQIARAMVL